MDLEMEFDKFCKLGRSPRTVLPPPHPQTKSESRSRKEKLSSRNDGYGYGLLSLDEEGLNLQTKGEIRSRKKKPGSRNDDHMFSRLEEEGFKDIKFRNYRSVSCKNPTSGDVKLECSEPLRRGSVYKSFRERKFRRPETGSGRKKIEFSLANETSYSFCILDSICGSDEEDEAQVLEGRSSIKPSGIDLKERPSYSGKSAERDLMVSQKFKCEEVKVHSSDANVLKERDTTSLNKSLSAKLALPHSPTHSDEESSKSSPKYRFTPIKKMFDPLTNSRNYRNPLTDAKSSGSVGTGRNKMLRKSLLHDFSSALPNTESDPACSPAHLHGNLKMEHKHGVPYFEFSTAHSEDMIVAKTWREEDALNWVYTFHSIQGRKRSHTSGWGIKYSNKDSPMIGQMQVSCYLCSELRVHGDSRSSMITEFVLYDIAHSRKSTSPEEEVSFGEGSNISGDSNEGVIKRNVELDDLFSLSKPRLPNTTATNRDNPDVTSPYPWALADLHPSQQIAAVVVQVPFKKRESLKYKRGDKLGNHDCDHASLLDLSIDGHHEKKSMVKVNVVTPLSSHGLPSNEESRGPSPLLDRWRVGGGCDCGGWDMACPLIVFGNSGTRHMKEHSLLQQDQPLNLYSQGSKEKVPSLTITIKEKGQYTVDFHAQLSALQAFAVCVAILHTNLHTNEASSLAEQEKNKQLLQCSSLKVLVEDEVKFLIEAVTEEERRKVTKTADENPTSFVLNPPFSPIARV